jgi:hypothetical protein
MVCYGARVSAVIAAAGLAAYVFWHAAIGHIIRIAGLTLGIMLLAGVTAVVALLAVRCARAVQRRRAAAGACTGCRFRCQQPLTVPGPARRPRHALLREEKVAAITPR